MNESGAEKLYVTSVNKPIVNLGVAVEASSSGSLIDPWFLGSPDERDVQGDSGTPVNVNNYMFDYSVDIGAAGSTFPKSKILLEKPRLAERSIRMSRTALSVNSLSQASTTASFSSVMVLSVLLRSKRVDTSRVT